MVFLVLAYHAMKAFRSTGVFLRLLLLEVVDDFEGGGRGAILIAHAIFDDEDLLLLVIDDVETSSCTEPQAPLPSCLPIFHPCPMS
jgi:hypothetical protein